jgi:hypothetical protein
MADHGSGADIRRSRPYDPERCSVSVAGRIFGAIIGLMKANYWGWLFFRSLRWLLWLSAVAYCIEFLVNRAGHLNSFCQLLLSTEFWMFSLPVTAVFAGFFELMMREQAGLRRPAFGRDWHGAMQ